MRNYLVLVAFLLIAGSAVAQSKADKEKAQLMLKQGVAKVDSGMFTEGINLFTEAQKLDKEKSTYTYEIAYALYAQAKYEDALKILKDIIDKKDAEDEYYRLVGNSYDYLKNSDKALDAYEKGIKRFPNSGKLYHEIGILYLEKEKYDEAVASWEKGISADPTFPSNYYRLGKIFSYTNERVWAVLYGEMFMNLERNTKRTVEMSKILFDTYQKAIHIDSDTSAGVSFTKEMVINADKKKFKIPFNNQYEMTMTVSLGLNMAGLKGKKQDVNMDYISIVRDNFINIWYSKDNAKNYPNVIFDYEKTIKEKGYLECYNHWILMKGDEDGFDAWYKNNKETYDKFAEWFNANQIEVNKHHFFVRTQYD